MRPTRNRSWVIAATAAALELGGCDVPSRHLPNIERPSVELFGLTKSSRFQKSLTRAVSTANVILRLENSYKISEPNTPVQGSISVYLVSGDNLGEREFAFVIPELNAIIFNADKIPDLVRTYGADASHLSTANPQSLDERYISGILALTLLHEIGHIRQLETHEDNVGLEPVAWSNITALAGNSRNRELNADYFAAHLLRVSWNVVQAAENDPLQFIRSKRATGGELQEILDLHDTLQKGIYRIKHRGQFGAVTSYSHLDNDLRLLIYWTVAHTDGNMADLINSELGRRNAEDKFSKLELKGGSVPEIGALPLKFRKYITGLKSSDQQTRDGTARALRAEEPLPLGLLPILVDSLNQRYGKTNSITYVLQSYGRKAVPDLIKALKSANPDVRENAALCLTQMGKTEAKTAQSALRKALSDENRYVRIRARAALGLPPTERLTDADAIK